MRVFLIAVFANSLFLVSDINMRDRRELVI